MLLLQLAPISYYHIPLIVDLAPSTNQIKKMFEVEAYWTEHEEFKETIERCWAQDGVNIINKLNLVKTNLDDWSKKTFKRVDYKIKKLKRNLEKLHKLPPTKENMENRFKI